MTHGNGIVSDYTYDVASQLKLLTHKLGATVINSFDYTTYDRVGNRKSMTNRDGLHSYTYDELNRLSEAINPLPSNPLESFTLYDAVGNRKSRIRTDILRSMRPISCKKTTISFTICTTTTVI